MTGDNQSVSHDVTAIQEAKLIRTTLKPKHLPQNKFEQKSRGFIDYGEPESDISQVNLFDAQINYKIR